jgi:hypothetical protein
VECLAYFRPDPEVMAASELIAGEADDRGEPPGYGVVPVEWVQ